jgi:hypothetical protein
MEANMSAFIPFIHLPKPKKKEQEAQIPLYVERPPPAREPEKPEKPEEEETPRVIIIEL